MPLALQVLLGVAGILAVVLLVLPIVSKDKHTVSAFFLLHLIMYFAGPIMGIPGLIPILMDSPWWYSVVAIVLYVAGLVFLWIIFRRMEYLTNTDKPQLIPSWRAALPGGLRERSH